MPRWLIWPVFALLMGFALGGSLVWGVLYVPPHQHAANNYQPAGQAAKKENASKFWEKAGDDPVAYFTLWLVAFTGVLAISTIGLWIVTWQSGKRQSKDMRESVDAANRSADVAERALLSVEIPYLYPFIRRHGFITSRSARTGQLGVSQLNYGNEFIEYYFKNVGRTPAEIIEVQTVLLPSRGMPNPWTGIDRNLNPLFGCIVAAGGGESRDFAYAFNKGMFETYSKGKFNRDTDVFYFLGLVRYSDVFGSEYVRGFCLGYSPMTDSFYPVGGEVYNYRRQTMAAGQSLPT